jgi:hypothetical protein
MTPNVYVDAEGRIVNRKARRKIDALKRLAARAAARTRARDDAKKIRQRGTILPNGAVIEHV